NSRYVGRFKLYLDGSVHYQAFRAFEQMQIDPSRPTWAKGLPSSSGLRGGVLADRPAIDPAREAAAGRCSCRHSITKPYSAAVTWTPSRLFRVKTLVRSLPSTMLKAEKTCWFRKNAPLLPQRDRCQYHAAEASRHLGECCGSVRPSRTKA